MSDQLDVNPEEIAEGGELPLPDESEGMETETTETSFSFFDGTPLSNSEPDQPIDEVDGFRLSPEYATKYLQRGVNKLIQSNSPAWLDLSLAGVNAVYAVFGGIGGGGGDGESETNTPEEPEIKK